jgi:hypothetical protein
MIKAMVDIDNTICKTNAMLMARIQGFHENIYPYPLPEQFFELNPDVYLDAKPFDGAADKLQEFVANGNSVAYVTARKSWTKLITDHWLKKNGFPLSPVVFTTNKRMVAMTIRPSICIEDAPHELDRLIDLIPAFVPATLYNQQYKNRFSEWNEIDLLAINNNTFSAEVR